jgi:hypothetical protein
MRLAWRAAVPRGVLTGLLLAVGVVDAAAETVYHVEWRSFARLSHLHDGQMVTQQGALEGRGWARLSEVVPGLRQLEFEGPDGSGAALLGPDGPLDLTFPTAVPVGHPPAPQHLIGGWFELHGDPDDPTGFELHYAEGFICRTAPEGCAGVDGWERFFTATGTRVHASGNRPRVRRSRRRVRRTRAPAGGRPPPSRRARPA